MPASVDCSGRRYRHVLTFKHDFFAATGLYEDAGEQVVLKVGRTTHLFGFPMAWIGAFLRRREVRLYKLAERLPGVPRYVGSSGPTGFVHEFVPGHALGRKEAVSDAFFDQLATLLRELHGLHIAYVDLNKRQNVLVDDRGRPFLIDFQISLHLPPHGWRRHAPVRWLLARFQQADRYHCLKHKRRLRPDLLTPDEQRQIARLSIWIRLHRAWARPMTHLRRAILRRLHRHERVPVAGSSAK